MAWITIARIYKQGTVLKYTPNAQLSYSGYGSKKSGKYEAATILWELKEDKSADTVKITRSWLDMDYQEDLRDAVDALNQCDEITIVFERKGPEDKILEAGDDKEALKKVARWGVAEVHKGFIVPEGMSKPQDRKGYKKEPFDNVGVTFGNAVNVAFVMKPSNAKAQTVLDFAREEIYPVSEAVREEAGKIAAARELSAGVLGAKVGQMLLIAAQRAKTPEELKKAAIMLFSASLEAEDALRESLKAPEDDGKDAKEDPEEGGQGEDEDFDDDIPF